MECQWGTWKSPGSTGQLSTWHTKSTVDITVVTNWGFYFKPHCFVNTLRRRQHGHRFADDILKRIFFNENVKISIKISLKFVPKGPINNIPALIQIMAWRQPGDKPLSEPMMIRLPTHRCVARPQWVKIPHITWPTVLCRFGCVWC